MAVIRFYEGGCHCGRVRFEVRGQLDKVFICNCSICAKKGYLHWLIPASDFRLLTPMADVATYCFNSGTAKHHFCRRCGTSPFHVPRGRPGHIDVNVRCLEDTDNLHLAVEYFDGRHWEQAIESFNSRHGEVGC